MLDPLHLTHSSSFSFSIYMDLKHLSFENGTTRLSDVINFRSKMDTKDTKG